jgi:hypothetical protein
LPVETNEERYLYKDLLVRFLQSKSNADFEAFAEYWNRHYKCDGITVFKKSPSQLRDQFKSSKKTSETSTVIKTNSGHLSGLREMLVRGMPDKGLLKCCINI